MTNYTIKRTVQPAPRRVSDYTCPDSTGATQYDSLTEAQKGCFNILTGEWDPGWKGDLEHAPAPMPRMTREHTERHRTAILAQLDHIFESVDYDAEGFAINPISYYFHRELAEREHSARPGTQVVAPATAHLRLSLEYTPSQIEEGLRFSEKWRDDLDKHQDGARTVSSSGGPNSGQP